MARPVDPHRREAVRAQAADYVLERGLARLSLRPLAKALGTSPRMLLYDFGTKERLIHEILGEIRNREAAQLRADVHTLEDVWRWIAAPEREARATPPSTGPRLRSLRSYGKTSTSIRSSGMNSTGSKVSQLSGISRRGSSARSWRQSRSASPFSA